MKPKMKAMAVWRSIKQGDNVFFGRRLVFLEGVICLGARGFSICVFMGVALDFIPGDYRGYLGMEICTVRSRYYY